MKTAFVKKVSIAALLIFICAVGLTFASTTRSISVSFENLRYIIQQKQVQANPDTPGFIYNGTTYVPLRFIGESLGQSVNWDGKTKTITMTDQHASTTESSDLYKQIEQLKMEVEKLNQELETLKSGHTTDHEVTYTTHQHGNFTLHFTPTAYKDYGYLHTDFSKLTKPMFNYFGADDVGHHVNVYIQSKKDRVEYQNEGAFYESGQRIIVINPDFNFEMAGHDSVRFVFIHELTHAMQDSTWGFEVLTKVTNHEKNWILEGHADYVAKKLTGYTQYGANGDPAGSARTQEYYYNEIQYRNGVNGWKPLDWSNIKTFQQLSLHRDEYFAFEAIVNFIEQKYSLNHYRLLLNEMAKGKNGEEAIKAVFKKTDVQLMDEYKAFYKL